MTTDHTDDTDFARSALECGDLVPLWDFTTNSENFCEPTDTNKHEREDLERTTDNMDFTDPSLPIAEILNPKNYHMKCGA